VASSKPIVADEGVAPGHALYAEGEGDPEHEHRHEARAAHEPEHDDERYHRERRRGQGETRCASPSWLGPNATSLRRASAAGRHAVPLLAPTQDLEPFREAAMACLNRFASVKKHRLIGMRVEGLMRLWSRADVS
jgi:hypothetical protein